MPEAAVSIGDKYVLKIGSERQQIFIFKKLNEGQS
jgi:hypothetical protein